LKEEIQARKVFQANIQGIKQEYVEHLMSFLDPQSLEAHSHNLSLVNSLLKNRSFYISEEIYLYLKNLEPNELADKIGFLNIVINSIDKTISSIQSEEERAYYLENSEKIQFALNIWLKNFEKYKKFEFLEEQELLEKLKASFPKNKK
jgi:hypothetical protein